MNSSSLILRLYALSLWVSRVAATNILWILSNIPIAYLSFNLLFIKTFEELLVNVVTITILAPFIFFPATTAMFGVVRRWVIGEAHIPILRSYLKYYKENYVRSMIGGLIISPLWLILFIDYVYFSKGNSPLYYAFLLVGMFLLVFTFHFFSNTVHVHLKFSHVLKNSILLSIGRPVHSIGITAINLAIIYLSVNVFTFLILIGMGTMIAFASFFIYYRSLNVS